MANSPAKHNGIAWGCLIAVAVFVILIATATLLFNRWNNYWYEDDNALRREPMDNLVHFHDELKTYLAEHEGRYPAEHGVHGLAELTARLSDLRVKDDRHVSTDPDYLSERITSYAYVASGLSEKEMESGMPVIFEKPSHRDSVRVLLSDGHVEVLENRGFKYCRQVVEFYKERSNETSAAWEILLRNAESIY